MKLVFPKKPPKKTWSESRKLAAAAKRLFPKMPMTEEEKAASRAEGARKRGEARNKRVAAAIDREARNQASIDAQMKSVREALNRRFPPKPPEPKLTSEPGDATHEDALREDARRDLDWWTHRKLGIAQKYEMREMMLRLDLTADPDMSAWDWTKCKTRLEMHAWEKGRNAAPKSSAAPE